MNDERVEHLIAELEVPVEPRREFGPMLFAQLEQELQRPAAGWPTFPRLRGRRWQVVFGVATALLVVVAAMLTVAQPARASPAATIRQAQQGIAGLSQVRATIHYDINPDGSYRDIPQGTTADVEVTYVRGVGYRQQLIGASGPIPASGGVGSFVVWDGTYVGSNWMAGPYHVFAPPADFDPLYGAGWNSPDSHWEALCALGASEVLPDAIIAGRAARHLRCGYSDFWELWVDRETGFMLKIQGLLGRDDFKLGTSAKGGVEVTHIEYTFDVDRSLFTVPAPPGGFPSPRPAATATPAIDPYTHTALRSGEIAPSWSGQLLDGSTFRLEQARGRPFLVLFWADWCPPETCGLVLRQYNEVSLRYAGRAGFVSVDVTGNADSARKIMSDLGYTFPVLVTKPQDARPWDVDVVPLLVLLDRNGHVVEVRVGPETVERMEPMLRSVGL